MKTLFFVFSSLLIAACQQDQPAILEFSYKTNKYEVRVRDGQVTGGKARGESLWSITGGYYDGQYLHITLVSPARTGCQSWYSHAFQIRSQGPVLKGSIDKCGQLFQNDTQHYWD